MKEYLAQKKRIVKPDGSSAEVSYSIVAEILSGEDGQPVCECYGISAHSSCGEKAVVRAVTISLKQIQEMIHLLAENDVLPMQLSESVENCLDRL